ncbi:formate dehydrogenase subunit gamma [Methylobacterium sp. 17Sr1-1]|uniref:formate dehydrogenase subunit gamma n=1 Tax=Methylobacterium sp. 17Sr1-1 TaxID=2202826 RepID=UPI000D6F6471|nr:formate dehydrogenase subunit gamma [Methylobacterium sp. 17Sr1-1]AWN53102.1 formate dehydrogenase subunit gamma [Methylobacterium sp. 17Sr1-1]
MPSHDLGRGAGREPWDADRAAAIVASHAHREGATLPILHALQDTFGYVDREAVPLIAEALNLSRAEVHGCLTFYHDFRSEPAGRHTVKLCRAEACQAMGADALHEDVLARYDVAWHGTTRDGRVTVEPVFCLGLCACGPAALVDGEPVGRLDLDTLADALTERAA